MRPRLATIAAAAACLVAGGLAALPVHAARPLVTEDAPVQAEGECLLDTFGARSAAHGEAGQSASTAQLGCGLPLRTQVCVGLTDLRANGPLSRAFGVGAKSALLGDEDAPLQVSVSYGLAYEGESSPWKRWSEGYVALVATTHFTTDSAIHLNLGWSHLARADRRDAIAWAAAVEHPLTSQLRLVGEAFGNDRRRAPWYQIGGVQSLDRQLSLNASYGMRPGESRQRLLTVGLTALL